MDHSPLFPFPMARVTDKVWHKKHDKESLDLATRNHFDPKSAQIMSTTVTLSY